uniref:Uncharacterized protein TCIL3000_5_3130 n=1 Tax=Trypanosoma congolense (strain IL3000) TaxID=1068625 RepID=G0ULS7_TRYCI|nr:unnamed protein product [Trypanosoma congolense IL3000]
MSLTAERLDGIECNGSFFLYMSDDYNVGVYSLVGDVAFPRMQVAVADEYGFSPDLSRCDGWTVSEESLVGDDTAARSNISDGEWGDGCCGNRRALPAGTSPCEYDVENSTSCVWDCYTEIDALDMSQLSPRDVSLASEERGDTPKTLLTDYVLPQINLTSCAFSFSFRTASVQSIVPTPRPTVKENKCSFPSVVHGDKVRRGGAASEVPPSGAVTAVGPTKPQTGPVGATNVIRNMPSSAVRTTQSIRVGFLNRKEELLRRKFEKYECIERTAFLERFENGLKALAAHRNVFKRGTVSMSPSHTISNSTKPLDGRRNKTTIQAFPSTDSLFAREGLPKFPRMEAGSSLIFPEGEPRASTSAGRTAATCIVANTTSANATSFPAPNAFRKVPEGFADVRTIIHHKMKGKLV